MTLLDVMVTGTPALRWVVLIALLVLVALWGFDRVPKTWLAIAAIVLIALLAVDAMR
jgi:Ca2+/H+ antiporter